VVRRHLETKHLVDAVALFGIEGAERFRNHTCVGLEKSSRIVLKVLKTVAAVFERREFASGSLTGFLEGSELGAQFVEGDESFGSHVLEAAPLALRIRELLQPHFRLALRVTVKAIAFVFQHRLKPLLQALGT